MCLCEQSLFEGAALAKTKPTLVQSSGLVNEEHDVQAGGLWGDDDMPLDDEDAMLKDENDIGDEEGTNGC